MEYEIQPQVFFLIFVHINIRLCTIYIFISVEAQNIRMTKTFYGLRYSSIGERMLLPAISIILQILTKIQYQGFRSFRSQRVYIVQDFFRENEFYTS